MIASFAGRVIIFATIAAAGTGALDAARGGDFDLVVVFGVVVGLQVVLLWRVATGRLPVAVRADLVAWLRDRHALTGEPLERIADRCVADYRATLDRER
jgi:hypothetical protein